ncbi:glycosyltransferase family 4 protein [Novosphingobium panipatense]|uniref:glycosyltransferase family 4 protein n=1 Tax=Novosphingobium panipatense TaxID=428991 RepID=UPI00360A2F25
MPSYARTTTAAYRFHPPLQDTRPYRGSLRGDKRRRGGSLPQSLPTPVHRDPQRAGTEPASDLPAHANGSRPRILTVGAISQQKNYTLLIETARVMQARAGPGRPAPLFRIAGGGADLARLQAQVSSLGLTDIIEFLGERADVPDLLVESDVYLNTSLYEGFSIAILEALSSAVPVVATDVPGNSGLVRTGYNGLLCAERPEALAAAIERVTSESTLYRRLSEGALASVANFTLDGAARRHLDLYDSLLRRRAARRD